MSDKIKAADEIRNLARMYKNMVSVADQLEQIGQLEQVQRESADAVAKARAELAQVDAQKATVIAQIAAEQANINAMFATAKESAALQISDAKQEAQKIILDAKRSSEKVEQAINAQCDLLAAKARAAKADAEAECSRIYAAADAGRAEIVSQQAELDRLNDAIAQARAVMANVMGA